MEQVGSREERCETRGVSRPVISFDGFYLAEHARLFGAMVLVTGNRHEAEEIMQEGFLRVYERWDRVREADDPTAYLYRVSFNVFRRRRRRAALAEKLPLALAHSPDAFAGVDEKDVIIRAMSGLTRRQRAALVLTSILEYSSEEAGQILGVKAGTVRVLASQARDALRKNVGDPL
jgi:RNA polymerase sigma-70 factor (ECF subfamily)